MHEDLDLGPQPIGELLRKHELVPNDLVRASTEQLTHKMVARAVKGRRLTANVMHKVLDALNAAAASQYTLRELFNYEPARRERRVGGE